MCNVLPLLPGWQTSAQSSAVHVVATRAACRSLHAAMQFSIVQHELRAPPSQEDGLLLSRRIVINA